MIYARIDADGICNGVSALGDDAVEDGSLIKLDSFDVSYLGKKWTGKEWIEAERGEPEVEPDENGQMMLDVMAAQADMYEVQESTTEKVDAMKEDLKEIKEMLLDVMAAQADMYEGRAE